MTSRGLLVAAALLTAGCEAIVGDDTPRFFDDAGADADGDASGPDAAGPPAPEGPGDHGVVPSADAAPGGPPDPPDAPGPCSCMSSECKPHCGDGS